MKALLLLLLLGCEGGTKIDKCLPDFGSINGGDDVKVLGAGFATGVTVKLGAKSARIVSVTPSTIEIQTPASDGPGVVDVTVIGADGTAVRLRSAFRYQQEGKGR